MQRCVAILLTASLTLAPHARAQLVVRVESNGAGVYGAEVAVWSDSGLVALGRTDGAGILRLPLSREKTPISFISARRVGFSPGRLDFPAADSVTIWLAQSTAELPVVAVTARPLRCPARSDDEAVALWRRAAAHYSADQDAMSWGYIASVAEETVPSGERGFGDEPGVHRVGGVYADTDAMDHRAGQRGSLVYGGSLAFVYSTYHPGIGPAYERWTYPIMYGGGVGAFTSPYFGERHTFVVLGRSGDETTLGFCARSRSEPELEGELQVSADTLLLGARWTFRMPHDDEDAGGEATFGESRLGNARLLVAVTSSTWRRIRPGLYQQERYVLDAWKFGRSREQVRLP